MRGRQKIMLRARRNATTFHDHRMPRIQRTRSRPSRRALAIRRGHSLKLSRAILVRTRMLALRNRRGRQPSRARSRSRGRSSHNLVPNSRRVRHVRRRKPARSLSHGSSNRVRSSLSSVRHGRQRKPGRSLSRASSNPVPSSLSSVRHIRQRSNGKRLSRSSRNRVHPMNATIGHLRCSVV